jgi:glycine/D-amino acid oxidase-like deaminating enzyme
VEGLTVAGGRVRGVRVAGTGGTHEIATPAVVLAPGPLLGELAPLAKADLPVACERHLKLALEDHRGVVPREAPFLIWDDPQTLPWDPEARAELAASPETRWMTEALPPGAHLRPEGASPESRTLLVLWSYDCAPVAPAFPLPADPLFPELAVRGVARMVPGLAAYLDPLPRGYVDGGYYTRTPENRPLIGPLPVEGAFVSGAYGGFGIMAALAGGELLAAHVTGAPLPAYAPAFSPARYADPAYAARLAAWGDTGQI